MCHVNIYEYIITQCVAVCCSVLQCVAVCCSVLQHIKASRHTCVAIHLYTSTGIVHSCIVVCRSALQCVALCCNVLQCVVLHCVAV